MDKCEHDNSEMASDECTVLNASGLLDSLLCDPCLQDGCKLQAHGYCVDCGHNLCVDCFKIHRKPIPCRHHQLVDKPKAPGVKLPNVKDECTDKCKKHRNEVVKFYCEDHKQFGCSVCITLKHRNCDVGYIPTLAEKLFQTSEYILFKQSMESLAVKIRVQQDSVKDNILNVKKKTTKSIEEIRRLRDEVNTFFGKLENEIKTLEDSLHNAESTNISNMDTLSEQQRHLGDKIKKMQTEVKDRETSSQFCRMFFDLKGLKDTVDKYDKEIDSLERNNKISQVSLNLHKNLLKALHDMPTKCGSVVTKEGDLPLDRSSVDVNGIVVASDEVVVAVEYGTRDILAINRKQKKVSLIRAPHAVKGMCKFDVNEVVVWYANTIEVITVSGKLVTQMQIHNVGLKWPILCINNLITGFTIPRPLTIRMMNMNKSIEKTLPAFGNGLKLYGNPHFIAVNQEETLIYVSEFDKEIVICVTSDGDLKAQYSPNDGWDPRGLAVSRDGTVYVTDFSNNSIHVLTADLKKITVIDCEIFGIRNPDGLAYCSAENKLFVGMQDSNHIAVLSI